MFLHAFSEQVSASYFIDFCFLLPCYPFHPFSLMLCLLYRFSYTRSLSLVYGFSCESIYMCVYACVRECTDSVR